VETTHAAKKLMEQVVIDSKPMGECRPAMDAGIRVTSLISAATHSNGAVTLINRLL
jgi:hypothetical protein